MKDVERETGYVVVASREDVELKLPESGGYEKLTPVDEKEIPADYKQGITLPILMAFRYLEHPYKLKLAARRHEGASVVVAVIESAKLDTTVTEEGHVMTDLVCQVRNSREQYLTLELPKDAEIWHAFVAGKTVSPLKEAEQGVLKTKLPIAAAGKTSDTFEVRLRFGSKDDPLGRIGRLDLACPKMNVRIMRLGWVVQLPEGYDLIWDRGNMRRLPHGGAFDAQLLQLATDTPVSETQTASAQPKAGRQVPREYTSNALVIRALEREAEKGQGRKAAAARSVYTGHKPDLPSKFYFQSLIVAPEEVGTVRSQYVRKSLGLPVHGLIILVTFAVAAWFWRVLPFTDATKTGVYLAAMLLLLAIRTLGEGAYLEQLTAAFWTLALTTVVLAGYAFYGKVRERMEAKEA